MADYIPGNDAAFNTWYKFLNQYVNGKCTGQSPEWTHIPQDALAAQQSAYAAWYNAYALTFGPHTPVETEAKNDAKKAAKAAVRPFVNQYLCAKRKLPELTPGVLATPKLPRQSPSDFAR
jgi:hypothetical protein